MATAAQITANRANARFSTGPKTDAGKLSSSQNAARHGFTSTRLNLSEATRQDFEHFKLELLQDVRPEGAIEETLFERFLLANWNLRRIARYETELLDETNPFAPGDPGAAAGFDRLTRYRRDLERSSQRALAELRKLQTERTVLLQQSEFVVDKLYNAAPLVELSRLTGETDPLIFSNSLHRGSSFQQSRKAASETVRIAQARRVPETPSVVYQHLSDPAAFPAPQPITR